MQGSRNDETLPHMYMVLEQDNAMTGLVPVIISRHGTLLPPVEV